MLGRTIDLGVNELSRYLLSSHIFFVLFNLQSPRSVAFSHSGAARCNRVPVTSRLSSLVESSGVYPLGASIRALDLNGVKYFWQCLVDDGTSLQRERNPSFSLYHLLNKIRPRLLHREFVDSSLVWRNKWLVSGLLSPIGYALYVFSFFFGSRRGYWLQDMYNRLAMDRNTSSLTFHGDCLWAYRFASCCVLHRNRWNWLCSSYLRVYSWSALNSCLSVQWVSCDVPQLKLNIAPSVGFWKWEETAKHEKWCTSCMVTSVGMLRNSNMPRCTIQSRQRLQSEVANWAISGRPAPWLEELSLLSASRCSVNLQASMVI